MLETLFGQFEEPQAKKPKRERIREAVKAAGRARDAALAKVDGGSDPRDLSKLLAAAEGVVESTETFTTEDVWTRAGGREAIRGDGRLMGAVMSRLRRAKLCEPTNDFKPSGHVANHNRPVRVWRSLVAGG